VNRKTVALFLLLVTSLFFVNIVYAQEEEVEASTIGGTIIAFTIGLCALVFALKALHGREEGESLD